MATALTNEKAKNTYKDLLHLGAGNVGLTASTPQQVYDGLGNSAPFRLAQDEMQMTQPLTLANGLVGAPSLSFANSLTTGFYRQAADVIGIAVAGALDFKIGANAMNVLSGSTLTIDSGATLTVTGTLTTLTVAQGGTGAATFTDGGLLVGSGSSAITALAVLADGEMIVGDGTTDPVAESGATLRTSVGVGTGDSPQFTGIELGHATDTTLTRASAGDVNVEGNIVYRAGGTDVPVTDGGTGVSTLTDGGLLVGSGAGAITALAVLADSEMIVGDGTTDPVAESGATLRTSIGVGTTDDVQFARVFIGQAAVANEVFALTSANSGGVIGTLTQTGAEPYGLMMDFSVATKDNNTNYFYVFRDATTTRAILYSDGDWVNHDGTYGTISDANLKQDIDPAESQWDDVKALAGMMKKYRIKTKVQADRNAPYHIGLIAQDVESVSPGLVMDVMWNDRPTKAIKSSILFTKGLSVIGELCERVEALEAA